VRSPCGAPRARFSRSTPHELEELHLPAIPVAEAHPARATTQCRPCPLRTGEPDKILRSRTAVWAVTSSSDNLGRTMSSRLKLPVLAAGLQILEWESPFLRK
jgi:hypothetical protein